MFSQEVEASLPGPWLGGPTCWLVNQSVLFIGKAVVRTSAREALAR